MVQNRRPVTMSSVVRFLYWFHLRNPIWKQYQRYPSWFLVEHWKNWSFFTIYGHKNGKNEPKAKYEDFEETIMIFIDDQIDLKKLCRIKKKSNSKACLELILWAIFFFLMTSSRSRTTDRKLSFHGKKVIGPTFILFSFPND